MKTTGELRTILGKAIVDVSDNKISLEKARVMSKLAGRINDSFYVEIKSEMTKLNP